MRRWLAAAALLAALGPLGARAAAQDHGSGDAPVTTVTMHGKAFHPFRLEVLAGETVRWTNDDIADHEVADDGDAFRSERLMPGMSYSHTYASPGTFTYHCPLHPFMTGQVTVYALALRGPRAGVAPGHLATLTGRAPAGAGAVTIERRADDGSWQAVTVVQPAADLTFTADVQPGAPARYRARAGTLTSPVVAVTLAADLTLRARRTGRAIRLVAGAAPAQSGARVALQHWIRERYDWRTIATGRFDRHSRHTFTVRSRRAGRYRVLMTRGVAGYGTSASPAVRVRAAARRGHR
jgi:plastocyanin